jgi:hypothetical protein
MHAHAVPHGAGVTALELVARNRRVHVNLTAGELSRWLVASGLAVEHGGLLHATPLGRELGAGLV